MATPQPGGRRSRREGDRWVHQFSQTWLNDLSKCPEMARGSKPYTYTDSTALGSAVHAGIEDTFEFLHGDGDGFGHDAVEHYLDRLQSKDGWEYTKYSVAKVYEKAHQLFQTWYDEVLPDIVLDDTPPIEHRFERVLVDTPERLINLTGTIDLVDKHNVVWDWKTAGQEYEVWERQRYAFQPTAYTWAWATEDRFFQREWLEPPWDFRYCVLLISGGVQYVDVWRTWEHVNWLRQQAVAAATLIEAELAIWPLNDQGWHCSPKWCHKFDECKGAHAHEDWMTSYKEHGP